MFYIRLCSPIYEGFKPTQCIVLDSSATVVVLRCRDRYPVNFPSPNYQSKQGLFQSSYAELQNPGRKSKPANYSSAIISNLHRPNKPLTDPKSLNCFFSGGDFVSHP